MGDLPDELHCLSLCSGGGGLDLGVGLALGRTRVVCWVEWEAFAIEYLASRMEAGHLAPAPVWSDLRTFDGSPWRGTVDIVLAGYPCQPFSLAGKRRGQDDPRHLWPHVRRVVREVEPSVCFLENVPGHLSLGFGEVAADLEGLGYEVAAGLFTAAEVGASHRRERLFILATLGNPDRVAHADSPGRREQRRTVAVPAKDAAAERPFPPGPTDTEQWRAILRERDYLAPAQSEVRLLADGLADDRSRILRMLGNGVVPLQAAYAFCSLWAAIHGGRHLNNQE